MRPSIPPSLRQRRNPLVTYRLFLPSGLKRWRAATGENPRTVRNQMSLHTRVIVRARRPGSHFWSRTEDFGIPYTPDRADARRHVKVNECYQKLKALYGVVDIDFRDTN